MVAPLKSSLVDILPLVTAQLAAVTGINSANILLVARDAVPEFSGNPDLLVRVGPPRPHPDFEPGVGRFHLSILRTLQITPRSRRAVDMSDRDDQALLADEGHLALEEQVIDALHTWFPSNDDGDYVTQEPIHWGPSLQPVHVTPEHQTWIHSDLQFVLHYTLPQTDNGF